MPATPATTNPTTASPTADDWLRKYATQLTAALAVVVCVTGVMMFFKWYKGEVEAMHEWLGIGFVGALILHIARHRQPAGRMLTQTRTRLLLVCTGVIAAAFLLLAPAKTGNPLKQTVGAVLRAPLRDVAPLFDLSAAQAVARLSEAGFSNADPARSIQAMAIANHAPPLKLLNAVIEQNDKD